jgi:hypothetical protein
MLSLKATSTRWNRATASNLITDWSGTSLDIHDRKSWEQSLASLISPLSSMVMMPSTASISKRLTTGLRST